MLVIIWSSTWVAIKIGLEDCPPLLGAGVRFTLAGLVLLAVAAIQRRSLRTDWALGAVLVRLRARLLGRAVRALWPRRGAVRDPAAVHRGARQRAAARRAAAGRAA